MTKKIAFKTLGCRLNQYETDALVSQFSQGDYQIVDFNSKADIYIVNTCTVTNQSDHKSRQEIYKAGRNGDDAVLLVTGCMVNNHKDALKPKFDKVTYFVDNIHKSSIRSMVDAHFEGEMIEPSQLQADVFGFQPADETFHTRSFIKIQDGCDNFCTYCIVPKVRGRAVSRPLEDIIENIKQVLAFGYKEIVFTGVNISRYQYKDISFEDLLDEVLKIEGDFRLRISSIEADGFSDRLYDLFKHPKLMPHLHLCLQSGSDNILLKMRRFYDRKSFKEIVDAIRQRVPDFNFSTDMIVGFPGESEQDFEDSLNMSKEIGFSHIHTFKYSVRNGTRAARMENQIPEKVKTERSKKMRQLAEELKIEYRKKFIGRNDSVLIENVSKNTASGYGEFYVPVKIKNAGQITKNSFARVKITGIEDKENDPALLAELV